MTGTVTDPRNQYSQTAKAKSSGQETCMKNAGSFYRVRRFNRRVRGTDTWLAAKTDRLSFGFPPRGGPGGWLRRGENRVSPERHPEVREIPVSKSTNQFQPLPIGKSSLGLKARPRVITSMLAAMARTEPSIRATCITPADKVCNRFGSQLISEGWT